MKTPDAQKKADLVRTRNALGYLKTHPVTLAALIQVKSMAGISLREEAPGLSPMHAGPGHAASMLREMLTKRLVSLEKEWWEFWK